MGNYRRAGWPALPVLVTLTCLSLPSAFAQGNLWQQLKQTAKDAVHTTLDTSHDIDDTVDSVVNDVTGYSKYQRPDYSQQSNSYAQPNYSTPSYSPPSYSAPSYSPPTSPYSAPASTQHAPIYSPYSGNQRASYVLAHPEKFAQTPAQQHLPAGNVPVANASNMYPVSVAPGLPTTDHLNLTY